MTKPTLTTTVISDLAWEQLTNMDAPANSPIASTVAGVAPVQSWEETDQVLPNIGQVDNELLAAAGLSNTILISVKTEEVLKTITVSIGANGNWFVGGEDTGVAAKGTDEATIARPTGVYGVASVFHVGNTLTIGAGLMYCVKEGQNFFTMQTTAELNISVDASTTFITIDRTGTVRTYSSGINLWTIPESQALVALVIDTDGSVSSYAVPTVHNAMLMASAVIPYSQGAIGAASTATLQATIASQFAGQARQSADAAEAAKVVTQADAAITTTNAQLTEQWKNDAQAAATSAHQFADFADADRVATAADRAQVATDKAAVAADRSTVATDKGIVASDKAITLGYKNDAAASKNLAAEYAIKPENSIITGTVSDYSALHWAQKAQQWAQTVSSALVWKGQWSAAANTAPPTPAVGTGAHFYRISAAGTISSVTYEVGDYIHWDTVNLSWFKIDGTDAVMTVNGVAPVGGNVSITSITGNAGTATKLATARTIGGVSFDGSANINLPGVNAAGNQSTTGNAATATKLATARTIGGVSFDGTANINLPGVNAAGTQNTSGNAATATKLATPRAIGGVNFDGSADITLPGVNAAGSQNTSGNAATATKLQTARKINNVSFDGSADIVIPTSAKPVLAVDWVQLRTAMWTGYVPADGQLLNRADYPDAWAAIVANKVPVTVSDADWVNNTNFRGCFSPGDGSTTFRVPDYNGKTAGSIGAVFQRGDGLNSAGTGGHIQTDSIRAHSHGIPARWDAANAATDTNNLAYASSASTGGGTLQTATSSGTETRPVAVTGCWAVKMFDTVINPASIDAATLATQIAAANSNISVLDSRGVQVPLSTVLTPINGWVVTENECLVLDCGKYYSINCILRGSASVINHRIASWTKKVKYSWTLCHAGTASSFTPAYLVANLNAQVGDTLELNSATAPFYWAMFNMIAYKA